MEASTTVYNRNFEESITIFGEKGTVKVGGSNAIYFEHLDIDSYREDQVRDTKERILANPWGKPGHEGIIEDMEKAIKENREPAVNGEDGKNALGLVLAFYESAKLGQPVSI